MGFSIAWCAVREENAPQFLEQLGLVSTSQTEEVPESLISTARLQSGWRVLWYNKYDCPFFRTEDLSRISKDQDILLCLVEEHVMASSAEYWSRGERVWWVSHEGDSGPKGLSFEGHLPECFASVKKDMEEAQRAEGGDEADVDYIFEIPLKIAQSLAGFKHDEECPHLNEEQFVVLTSKSRDESKKGFFSKLFGK